MIELILLFIAFLIPGAKVPQLAENEKSVRRILW